MLNYLEFENAFQLATKKLYQQMILANRTECIDEYLGKLDIQIDQKYRERSKILVFGFTQVSHKELLDAAAVYGIGPEDIEFVTEKHDIKAFDCRNLKSIRYKGIIVGELPHKLLDLEGKESNLLKEIRNNPEDYQNVQVAKNNNRVRITKMSFINALVKIIMN